MNSNSVRFASRSTRRIWSWAAFGTVGLVLTATWAAGVANAPGANSLNTSSSPLVAGAPDNNTDRFDGTVALGPDTSLTVNFSGRWGVLPNAAGGANNDYQLFDVDLSDAEFDTGNYFIEVGLLATPVPAGFTVFQMDFLIDDDACATADFDPAADYDAVVGSDPDALAPGETVVSRVLFSDNLDNSVVFPNLTDDLGPNYCVGVAATGTSPADDTAGTFVRRADPDVAVTMPTFVAIVNEHT
jgi:hypothetical protein